MNSVCQSWNGTHKTKSPLILTSMTVSSDTYPEFDLGNQRHRERTSAKLRAIPRPVLIMLVEAHWLQTKKKNYLWSRYPQQHLPLEGHWTYNLKTETD